MAKVTYVSSGRRRFGLCDPEIRPLVMTVFGCVFATYCMAAVGAAFFPIVASSKQFGLSMTEVGAVFATLPLMVGLTSPLATYLSNIWGRLPLVVIGLALQALAALAFGFGDNTIWFIVCAAVDGLGAAFMEVASLGLLISNVSERDLQHVISWQEMLIGMGCVLGPPFGGLIYHFFGFKAVYVCSAAFLGAMWLIVVFNWMVNSRRWNHFDILNRARVSKDISRKSGTLTPPLPEVSPFAWCCSCAVLFGSFAVVQSFGTIGAIDVIFAPHLQASLGVDTGAIGALFSFQALVYVLSSSFVTKVTADLSPKITMFLGGVLTGISFLFIGPIPFSETYIDQPWMVWVLTVASLVIGQLGLACGLIPAVPLIKGYIDQQFTEVITATNAFHVLHDEVDEDEKEEEDEDTDDDGELIDFGGEQFFKTDTADDKVSNTVSTLFNTSASIGQAFGPVLAGILMDHLPKRMEVTCTSNCLSGFQWTATAFAGISFLAAICVLIFVPDIRNEEQLLSDETDEFIDHFKTIS